MNPDEKEINIYIEIFTTYVPNKYIETEPIVVKQD